MTKTGVIPLTQQEIVRIYGSGRDDLLAPARDECYDDCGIEGGRAAVRIRVCR